MIRWFAAPDAVETIAQIQYRAVREGTSPYTEAQRAAWVRDPHPPDALAARLRDARVVLFRRGAEDVGCMTLSPGGYIDMAFILPAHQGTGVFRALYEALEAQALRDREPRLWTFASLMAQAPFQAAGFRVIRHETVERAGEYLQRAEMEKVLE